MANPGVKVSKEIKSYEHGHQVMYLHFWAYIITGFIYCTLSALFSAFLVKKSRQVVKNNFRTNDVEKKPNKNADMGTTPSFPCALACVLTALWAFSSARSFSYLLSNVTFDVLQSLAWIWVLLTLFFRFNSTTNIFGSYSRARIILFSAAAILIAAMFANQTQLYLYNIYIKIIIAVMTLVIAENIYRNAPVSIRWHLNFLCISISGMAAFSLLLYGDEALKHNSSELFIDGRPIVYSLLAPLLMLGERRQRRWHRKISLSRSVIFYTTALLLSGSVLFGFGVAAALFRRYGAPLNGVAELAVMFCLGVWSIVLMTSGSARSQLKNLIINHFFSTRFDYQFEWTRCIETLRAVDATPLEKRVILALGDCVDSPSGALFIRTEYGGADHYVLAGAWNWPEHEIQDPLFDFEVDKNNGKFGVVAVSQDETPWKKYYPDLWLIVPLFGDSNAAPMGVILLAHARASFELDNEVFDLLNIVAREISLVLSEKRAVLEREHVKRFEETGRRLSFVAHDMKNLSSQLSILLKNAEDHMDNIEFRNDMLETLHGSLDKINAMLKKVNVPVNQDPPLTVPSHELPRVVSAVKAIYGRNVILELDEETAEISIDTYSFNEIIMHLIQNAIEASESAEPIKIVVCHKSDTVEIDVIDCEIGMTREFVREQLFRPFTTFKADGYGIGAYQARELARAVGGDIAVTTALGKGTSMHLVFPKCRSGIKPMLNKIEEKT